MYTLQGKKRKNSKKYTTIKDLGESIEDVKKYMADNNVQFAGTPYIFTHINLSDGTIIVQTHTPTGFICSPTKLRDALIK